MERVPQELVDKFIDELKEDEESLLACSLISRCWVGRSRHHLFQRIVFTTAEVFAKYCDLFPTGHSVQSYIRGVAVIQWNRQPWVNKQALHCGLEHLKTFRSLESLILAGITNGSTQNGNAIEALADGFGEVAPSIKTVKLVHWKVSPTALIEFICRFPSLDNLVVEDMDYLVGLPDWKRPFKFPRFAGRFEFTDSYGHGSAEKFLRLLSRLPLSFREISIDAGFSGAPDPIIAILEKCSLVLVRASLYYGYRSGMGTVILYSLTELLTKKHYIIAAYFPEATIREINASFPELRELTLKPDPKYAGTVDDLALKLLSVISSLQLSHVTLDHTAPHSFGLADPTKWREADRTMFELARRTGRKVAFSWYFPHGVEDVERIIRPLLERLDSLGTLRILESDEEGSDVMVDGWYEVVVGEADWTNVPFTA